MTQLDAALKFVGVDLNLSADLSIGNAIDEFANQNINVASLISTSQSAIGLQGNGSGGSTAGDFEHVHYANDLIDHQPKFKFLFKVLFENFYDGDAQNTYYYFVQSCDKPKVRFNHTEVNYYNFRTKVLTSTTYEPMSITFLDEIGNTVNSFFANYLKQRSGQGSGNWGINDGMTPGKPSSSSSYPYEETGYASKAGSRITIEQIFANGTLSNRFIFENPRIESMDFDNLDMATNDVNYLTVTFNYDSIRCETVETSILYSWGDNEIHKGGGKAGSNGGSIEGGPSDQISIGSTGGQRSSNNALKEQSYKIPKFNTLPASLQNIPGISDNQIFGNITNLKNDIISSANNIVSKNISDTLKAIKSGSNLRLDNNG